MELLERPAQRRAQRVAGYGASGRANTIIQYCGIGHEHLEYMIDDAPAKWGYYTPGSHFEIRSERGAAQADAARLPVLIFAWGYLQRDRREVHAPISTAAGA